jgi:hypothetical protein
MADARQVEPNFKAPKLSKRKRTERIWAAKKAHRVELLEEVLLRCHGDCEIGSPDCTGRGHHLHHALRRSQGGRDRLEDVRLSCAPCHDYLHTHVAEAFDKGWLLRKGDADG